MDGGKIMSSVGEGSAQRRSWLLIFWDPTWEMNGNGEVRMVQRSRRWWSVDFLVIFHRSRSTVLSLEFCGVGTLRIFGVKLVEAWSLNCRGLEFGFVEEFGNEEHLVVLSIHAIALR
ncbi:hypothetical protein Droror1_Dr00016496 [Drosera rotundifolia]